MGDPRSESPKVKTPSPRRSPKSASPRDPSSTQDPTDAPLVADTEDVGDTVDGDSTYESVMSSSASMASSIFRHRQENGRTYHAYKELKYIMPNDEAENDRLDLQHHIFSLTYDGALHSCPAGKDPTKPLRRVLDAGTGTGIWAIDFADEHPETHVIGIDLSPIQPAFVPPNLSFYIDDLEEPWTFSEKFDFIYCRFLTGSIGNWPKFMETAYENLSPGGWIEIADIMSPIDCDDGTLTEDTPLLKWSTLLLQAAGQLGRPIDSARLYKQQLLDAGFTNVMERVHKWPQNAWAKDKKHKEIGAWSELNFTEGLNAMSVALLTRGLGWTAEEVEILLIDVRKDIKNKSIHAYWPIWIVYAEKPEAEKA
ncbi:S-adenosyl-L-methionine-dependent methyltransferase [Podospora appendiculata]|uniref:S-adenosyl-L-methionine-dependent methyltransferase n=1 Tax=Podospora appendiculata TaxID=314037 RepID=A0AAE1C6W8_9PEZI|nr:S-adenosyl-L-methionine-dependent methyltransferase [Podospora appendiculata]